MKQQYPIDTTRIFATGASLGGSFAHDLACHDPSLLAGVAVVASLPSADELPICRQALRPLIVLLMIGDSDPNVPVDGGGMYDYLSADSTARMWAVRDSCTSPAVNGILPDRDGDGQSVLTTTYATCSNLAFVRLFVV